MRALVQRVSEAKVTVDDKVISVIGQGVLIFLGVAHVDSEAEATLLARKIASLRIFEDDGGKMNLALAEVGGAALVVSQFTLYADIRKGRRPSFSTAAPPELAEQLYANFCRWLAADGVPVYQGAFRAHMHVALVNDGPVTIWLDTDDLAQSR
jgi:D-aminoacyl-tRNA deacylase